MCNIQCLLAVFVTFIALVNSWDFAITTGDQLEFYTNETKTNNEGVRFRELTALAYDAVHNMLLFVDKQNDNASIFSLHLATKKYQALVRRRSAENIQGLAFDPVKSLLFWTDTTEKSIFWISLVPGYKNDIYGNLLLKMNDEIPRAIAVDSCRGFIYWTNINITKPTIERARFDGSEREIIVDKNIYMPVSIAIDQRTKTIYWADDREGIHYSIESANLNGQKRKTLLTGTYHQPNALTVSKDSIYWVDWGYKSVWKLPKNAGQKVDIEPTEIIGFSNEAPFGIVANYQIADQAQGVQECQELLGFSQNKTVINDSFNIPRDVGLFCLHGVKMEGKLACKCSPGYSGERCEVSVCHNYCFQGDCNFESDGNPKCSCKDGFTGARCEINMCDNHCLNNGVCSIDENKKAICQCSKKYDGLRCETLKHAETAPPKTEVSSESTTSRKCKIGYTGENCDVNICDNYCDNHGICSVDQEGHRHCKCPEGYEGFRCESLKSDLPQLTKIYESSPESCNCTRDQNESNSVAFYSDNMQKSAGIHYVDVSCDAGWDSVRDPVIMVLGIVCGLLCMTSTFLCTRVMKLKKRPRIKKRIIVNKNVTPMTARPDQCEITIENCCNMNICETPCFEPRSTIRPTLLDSKPGKEEKKTLITNMEYPEDY